MPNNTKQLRRNLTEKDKDIIGRKCANCESTINLEYHHIFPIALGGSNLLSNHVCLCSKCHRALHMGVLELNYNKLGAVHENVGRPKVTIKDINEDLKNDILAGVLNITNISRKHGISRRTVYKYKKIIEETLNISMEGEIK